MKAFKIRKDNQIFDYRLGKKINLDKVKKFFENKNYQEKFFNKVKLHFQSIPKNITYQYNLSKLLKLIKTKISTLRCKTRHGDFAPWHLIFGDKIFLIDGEHAMSQSVEYYDIGYFIQRVFSVWKNKKLAEKIYLKLMNRKYDKNKLKTIMLARAIGGFLDESLSPNPNYKIHEEFISWILSI